MLALKEIQFSQSTSLFPHFPQVCTQYIFENHYYFCFHPPNEKCNLPSCHLLLIILNVLWLLSVKVIFHYVKKKSIFWKYFSLSFHVLNRTLVLPYNMNMIQVACYCFFYIPFLSPSRASQMP